MTGSRWSTDKDRARGKRVARPGVQAESSASLGAAAVKSKESGGGGKRRYRRTKEEDDAKNRARGDGSRSARPGIGTENGLTDENEAVEAIMIESDDEEKNERMRALEERNEALACEMEQLRMQNAGGTEIVERDDDEEEPAEDSSADRKAKRKKMCCLRSCILLSSKRNNQPDRADYNQRNPRARV